MRRMATGTNLTNADQNNVEEEIGRLYDNRVMVRIAKYLKPYKSLVALGAFTILIYTAAVVAIPLSLIHI